MFEVKFSLIEISGTSITSSRFLYCKTIPSSSKYERALLFFEVKTAKGTLSLISILITPSGSLKTTASFTKTFFQFFLPTISNLIL